MYPVICKKPIQHVNIVLNTRTISGNKDKTGCRLYITKKILGTVFFYSIV